MGCQGQTARGLLRSRMDGGSPGRDLGWTAGTQRCARMARGLPEPGTNGRAEARSKPKIDVTRCGLSFGSDGDALRLQLNSLESAKL